MIEYKDKVRYSKTGEVGIVLGFIRNLDKYLVKFEDDDEEWIYGRCLYKVGENDGSC